MIAAEIDGGRRAIQERDGANNPQVSSTRGRDLGSAGASPARSGAPAGLLDRAGGIGGLLARSAGYSAGRWTSHAYYHADGNGNITFLLASNQTLAASYRYDPYGNQVASSGPLASLNVYQFSSKESHAASGLYYYLYRWYDPTTQRWMNRDPIQEWGGINLYGFVGNAPTYVADADGRMGPGDWVIWSLRVWMALHRLDPRTPPFTEPPNPPRDPPVVEPTPTNPNSGPGCDKPTYQTPNPEPWPKTPPSQPNPPSPQPSDPWWVIPFWRWPVLIPIWEAPGWWQKSSEPVLA